MKTRTALLSLVAVVVSLLGYQGAEAGLFRRQPTQLIPPPAGIPAENFDAPPSPDMVMYAPSAVTLIPVRASAPKFGVSYRHVGRPIASSCDPVATRVLCVTNPQTCCKVEVPVCLPCCCDGSPKVHGRRTIIGDGVVHYEWCCGVTVSVRFDRCGDVLVTYRRA